LALNEISRAMIIAEIEGLKQSGRPGAAVYFRKCAATFLNWLVDRGAIAASPMASYRRPKETRAKRACTAPMGDDHPRRAQALLGGLIIFDLKTG
jgi:site-specific recombinase XerC